MKKVVDLTQTYTTDCPGFSRSVFKTLARDGWNASTLTFYSYSGTHMDAPVHFEASPQTIDQIPVENFMGEAWVVDLRSVGARDRLTNLDQLTSNRVELIALPLKIGEGDGAPARVLAIEHF